MTDQIQVGRNEEEDDNKEGGREGCSCVTTSKAVQEMGKHQRVLGSNEEGYTRQR